MVKKLSRVSCGSLKCFPHTFTTNIHLYINPKGGLKKILSFEQACHFCSKQAVQKQWSLSQLSARSTFLCRKRGLRWWYRFCSRSHGRSSVLLLYTLRPLQLVVGAQQCHSLQCICKLLCTSTLQQYYYTLIHSFQRRPLTTQKE